MKIKHEVRWIDGNRKAENPTDPECPEGIDINLAVAMHTSCKVSLAYPARRCGWYVIWCSACGLSAAVTTAGRADDPRSVRLPCRPIDPKEPKRRPSEGAKLALMRRADTEANSKYNLGGREKHASRAKRPVSLVKMPWDK